MSHHIKFSFVIAISVINGLTRFVGNIVKTLSYPFHWCFSKKRFVIPAFDPAKKPLSTPTTIPRIIWQTNYTNRVTLPVYCNFLFNRFLSPHFDYRYVSTEERDAYIKTHADERTYAAYCKLTDGAAQADFWRVFVLYQEGGVYLDIDGQLVWSLSSIIDPNDSEVLIKRRDKYTNFFLAAAPNSAFLKDTLDIIIDNINNQRIEGGVFHLTGPVTLNLALKGKSPNTRPDKLTCSQGTFTNEYFQYMDKKKGKWIYAKNEDLLK